MEIKRYEMECQSYHCSSPSTAIESKQGEWVRYDDIKHLLNSAQQRYNKIAAEVEEIHAGLQESAAENDLELFQCGMDRLDKLKRQLRHTA